MTVQLPKSPTDRLWLIGGCVAGAFILLIAYVALIGPQRSTTSDVRSQSAGVQHRIDALQARIDALRTESKDLPMYERELAAARAALPADSGIAPLLRTLQAIGAATSTTVSAVTVGAPTPVAPPAAPATGGAAPSTAPSSAPGAAAAYSMTISAQATGAAPDLVRFLAQLQKVQPRALLVTQVTETAGTGTTGRAAGSGGAVLSLTMLAFVAPRAASQQTAGA